MSPTLLTPQSPWTPADEAAWKAAAPEATIDPSSDEIAANRYTSVRAVLAKNAPLGLSDYLQAQTLFVMMDMMAEMAALRDEVQKLNEMNMELIVHRVPGECVGKRK